MTEITAEQRRERQREYQRIYRERRLAAVPINALQGLLDAGYVVTMSKQGEFYQCYVEGAAVQIAPSRVVGEVIPTVELLQRLARPPVIDWSQVL